MLALGFVEAPAIARLGSDSFTAPISHEQARLLEADVLITFGDPEPFESNPLYRNLEVVGADRVIAATDVLDQAFSTSSVLSIPYALDEIAPMLSTILS